MHHTLTGGAHRTICVHTRRRSTPLCCTVSSRIPQNTLPRGFHSLPLRLKLSRGCSRKTLYTVVKVSGFCRRVIRGNVKFYRLHALFSSWSREGGNFKFGMQKLRVLEHECAAGRKLVRKSCGDEGLQRCAKVKSES